MFKLLKVTGNSLAPEYGNGDYVLVSNLFRKPRQKDVIVFRNGTYGMMIKRVQQVRSNGTEYFVEGTHPDSIDSKRFGFVSKQDVIGKVLWHIRRKLVLLSDNR